MILNDQSSIGARMMSSESSSSVSSESGAPIESLPISEECEKFTLIREENGEYNLVPMELSETVVTDPAPRKRGRPRKYPK
jgi:hypothetical protein